MNNEHFKGLLDGFFKSYNCKYLLYHQHFSHIELAISGEKEPKNGIGENKKT
jgi:predicted GIY-YIG superfamily endonuclease